MNIKCRIKLNKKPYEKSHYKRKTTPSNGFKVVVVFMWSLFKFVAFVVVVMQRKNQKIKFVVTELSAW